VNYTQKYPDKVYIDFDPYMDDTPIRCQRVKLVETRKEHQCFDPSCGKPHPILIGTRARRESALIDGKWEVYYTCFECIDRYIEQAEG